MKLFTFFLIFHLLFFFAAPIAAQVDTTKTPENLIKTYLEESTENSKNPELYDLIENLLANPINLNTAAINDLLKIPFLDFESASLIVKFRREHGEFTSVNELQGITKLNAAIRNKIKPFVTVGNFRNSFNGFTIPFSFYARSRFIYNLKESSGFLKNKFAGSRIKSYQRFKAAYGKFRTAFLIEKDAGEISFADHYTFFIEAKNLKILKHIVVGNYLIEFGQGLVLWSPYSFSKGSDAINPLIKRDRNIVGYSSSDENNYFRGGAASLVFNHFRLSFFYSSNKIDANFNDSTLQIISLPQDGFHRTVGEILKKDKVTETFFGGRMDYSLPDFISIGLLYFNTSFNKTFYRNSLYSPRGKSFDFFSISYKLFLNKIMISGESAYNGISAAHISTLEFPVIRNFILLASVRSYPRNFNTFYAQGFGERSTTNNEIGFYTGIKWRTTIGTFNFYFDQFKFPFSTSAIPLPSTGNEFLLNYSTSFFRHTRFTLRYKNEKKETAEIFNQVKTIFNKITNNIRLDFLYQVTKFIRLRSRIEMIYINKQIINTNEKGFLIFQDLQWRLTRKIRFTGRIIFFQTDSFASRLYEFENDLTGILNNPALFGKGMRLYLMLNYKIGTLAISVKYAELYKPDVSSLGSGLSEITGNSDNTVNFQIDFNF